MFPLHLFASLRTLYILGSILSVDSLAIHVTQAMDGRVLVYNVSGDGAPTFQLRAFTAVHQTDQMAMSTDRHPSSNSYTSHFKRLLQLTREWKSSWYIPWLLLVIDYKLLTAEHALSFTDYRLQSTQFLLALYHNLMQLGSHLLNNK